MARLNVPTSPIFTHEGAKSPHITPEQQLRRSVCACLLWEDTFYEDGESIAQRIQNEITKVKPEVVAQVAIEAREQFNLRHVPLLLARELARVGHKGTADLLERIIQRPDELSEFLAIYWKDGKQPLSAQVKKGLARAFGKFNEYSLAKYNRNGAIKLRDVLFLCHAKAKDAEQDALWKRLIAGTLETPDTWEVEISKNKSNKESWERLLSENKLGGLALLRNLRNMTGAGVDTALINKALVEMKTDRILPFRFISAAKYAPHLEPALESAMLRCLAEQEKLKGKTAIVIDGSGSMFGCPVSAKSEIDRFDAAAALAILIREICEECVIIVFSYTANLVPPRHGFALRDALYQAAEQGGTQTQRGIKMAAKYGYDRLILVTDEQSHTSIHNPLPNTKGYVINVATYKNGIGYGPWVHINGWSEAVIKFIQEFERS